MRGLLNWMQKNKYQLIRSLFIIPIVLVAIISIFHVVSWYSMGNPIKWAIYLSIAIEVGALVSLAAASVRIKGGVWPVFIVVTIIQLIGNVFFSYQFIDIDSRQFKQWIELTLPIFEMMGVKETDIIAHKRWLAFLEGGTLPIISLASLHFFIKYTPSKEETTESNVVGATNTKSFRLENKPEPVAEKTKPAVEKPKPVAEKPKPVAEKPKPVAEKPKSTTENKKGAVFINKPFNRIFPNKKTRMDALSGNKPSRGFSKKIPKRK